ncbi:unnamed protein product [Sphagnum balticum]
MYVVFWSACFATSSSSSSSSSASKSDRNGVAATVPLAVAVAYKRPISSGMHNIAKFFSTLLSDLRTDPDQES